MRNLLFLIVLIIACGGGGSGPAPEPPPLRIVSCFGTSLTLDGFAPLLAQHQAELGIAVINNGFGGYSSRELLDHYAEILDEAPDIVLMESAINDSRQLLEYDEVRLNVTLMVNAFQAKGIKVYLMTTNPELYIPTLRPNLEEYYQVYRELAATLGTGLIDMYPLWMEMEPRDLSLYIPDNLHPSLEGLEAVAWPALREVLSP